MGVQDLINSFKAIIPPLTNSLHKGMMGRIGIFGGSPEYTGAPYFAGISALKAGADLVYVFSASSAAPVIKCYTPEMMVMPYLDSEDAIGLISPWLSRLHSILIGPGLGRRTKTFSTITQVIKSLKTRIETTAYQPLIFDADGLYYVMKNIEFVKDYPGEVYLTPNQVEFTNLVNCLVGYDCRESTDKKFELINQYLGSRVTVVLKGSTDLVYSSKKVFECDVEGSPRRCGGQGDMLCGILSVFTHWVTEHKKSLDLDIEPNEKSVPVSALGGIAACALMRTCNKLAYDKKYRSTVTSDMIEEIHIAFKQLYS